MEYHSTLLEQQTSFSSALDVKAFFVNLGLVKAFDSRSIAQLNERVIVKFVWEGSSQDFYFLQYKEYDTSDYKKIVSISSSDWKRGIWYQLSEKKDVIYMKIIPTTSLENGSTTFVFAKDENGVWSVFLDDYIYTDQGMCKYTNPICEGRINGNSIAIYTNVRRPDTGVKFPNLYHGLTIPHFKRHDCVYEKDTQKYRVVMPNSDSVNNPGPILAFPVSD